MKAYIFMMILAVLSCFNTANALRCYFCNSGTLEECKSNAVLITCPSASDSCLSVDNFGVYYRACFSAEMCSNLVNDYPVTNAKCCSSDGCNTIPGFNPIQQTTQTPTGFPTGFNGVDKIKPNFIAWLTFFGIIKYYL